MSVSEFEKAGRFLEQVYLVTRDHEAEKPKRFLEQIYLVIRDHEADYFLQINKTKISSG